MRGVENPPLLLNKKEVGDESRFSNNEDWQKFKIKEIENE